MPLCDRFPIRSFSHNPPDYGKRQQYNPLFEHNASVTILFRKRHCLSSIGRNWVVDECTRKSHEIRKPDHVHSSHHGIRLIRCKGKIQIMFVKSRKRHKPVIYEICRLPIRHVPILICQSIMNANLKLEGICGRILFRQ